MSYFDPESAGELKTAFDSRVLGWPDVSESLMFGCPSYRADELFAVLVTEGVVVTRLGEEERGRLKREFGGKPFEAGGRKVESWAMVPVDDVEDLDPLLPFVRTSYETAFSGDR